MISWKNRNVRIECKNDWQIQFPFILSKIQNKRLKIFANNRFSFHSSLSHSITKMTPMKAMKNVSSNVSILQPTSMSRIPAVRKRVASKRAPFSMRVSPSWRGARPYPHPFPVLPSTRTLDRCRARLPKRGNPWPARSHEEAYTRPNTLERTEACARGSARASEANSHRGAALWLTSSRRCAL